jgi:hypothetical protein
MLRTRVSPVPVMLTTRELTPGRWVRYDGQLLEVLDVTGRTVTLTDPDQLTEQTAHVSDLDQAVWELA